jgi:hypothetical protein
MSDHAVTNDLLLSPETVAAAERWWDIEREGRFNVLEVTADAHRFDPYRGKNMWIRGKLWSIGGVLDKNRLAVRDPKRFA